MCLSLGRGGGGGSRIIAVGVCVCVCKKADSLRFVSSSDRLQLVPQSNSHRCDVKQTEI